MKRTILVASIPVVGTLAGCTGEPATPEGRVDLGLGGGLQITLENEARLVVASADGRVLLDGLPSGSVADGAAPLVGFALRDLTTTYTMALGSFMPENAPGGPWRVATRVERREDAGGAVLDLLDSSGKTLARTRLSTPEEGHLLFDISPGDGPERRFSMGFACDPSDHFAGFGAQTADVDHRGYTVPTFVQEEGLGKDAGDEYTGAWFVKGRRHSSYAPIPQFLSRRGYMLAAETPREAWFALCSESESAARVEVDLPVKIHLFDGPSPGEAIRRSTATLGRPRMPPRVAFAPWNDAIFGSDNVRAVAKQLRKEKVPSSVIWTEDWNGSEWKGDTYQISEEWSLNKQLYPDFPELASDLHALGFHFHVYFDPFVYKTSSVWDMTAANGWLVKTEDGDPYSFFGSKGSATGLLDLDNPEARAWMVGKMRDAMAMGVDGWMNDFGEWLPTDSVTAEGSGIDRHNVYPVIWQQAAREAIDGMKDGKERLFYSRCGWLGTPSLADVVWGGDLRTTMQPDDGLPIVLPIGIGLGVSGVSTYGIEIAGYSSQSNEGSTKETFFRWTSLGAWTPVMRTHHGWAPLKNWAWNKDAETIEHFRRYAALHMSLVPMWESLAKAASESGMPIWRGLFMAYPEDEAVWALRDEVMVGDNLLLAPVQAAGQTARSVYLPRGLWYPWSGGAAQEGSRTVQINAPMTEIPVLAKAGTVIAAFPDGVMTLVNGSPQVPDAASVGDDRVVYVFLGDKGAFTEASGLSYQLDQGAPIAGALSFTASSTPLPACDASLAAPCVETLADRSIAHVIGATTLTLTGASGGSATLQATGGAPGRRLTFVVRR